MAFDDLSDEELAAISNGGGDVSAMSDAELEALAGGGGGNEPADLPSMAQRAGSNAWKMAQSAYELARDHPQQFHAEFKRQREYAIRDQAKQTVDYEARKAAEPGPLTAVGDAIGAGLEAVAGGTDNPVEDNLAQLKARLPRSMVAWARLGKQYALPWTEIAKRVDPTAYDAIASGQVTLPSEEDTAAAAQELTPEQLGQGGEVRQSAALAQPFNKPASHSWLEAAFSAPSMTDLIDTQRVARRGVTELPAAERDQRPLAVPPDELTPQIVNELEQRSREQFQAMNNQSPGQEDIADLRKLAELGYTYEQIRQPITVGEDETRTLDTEPSGIERVLNAVDKFGVPYAGKLDTPLGTILGSHWDLAHRDLELAKEDIGGLTDEEKRHAVTGWEVIRAQRERAYRDYLRQPDEASRAKWLLDNQRLGELAPWEPTPAEQLLGQMFGPGGVSAGEFFAGMAWDTLHDKTMILAGPGKTAAGRLARLAVQGEIMEGSALWRAMRKLSALERVPGKNLAEEAARRQWSGLRIELPGMEGGVPLLPRQVDEQIARAAMVVGDWIPKHVPSLPVALHYAFGTTAGLAPEVKEAVLVRDEIQRRAQYMKQVYQDKAFRYEQLFQKRAAELGIDATVMKAQLTDSLEFWATKEAQLTGGPNPLIKAGSDEHKALLEMKQHYEDWLNEEMGLGILKGGLNPDKSLTPEQLEYVYHLITPEALKHIEKTYKGGSTAKRVGRFLADLDAQAGGAPFALERKLKGSVREINASYASKLPEGVKLFDDDPVKLFLARAFAHLDATTPASTLKSVLARLGIEAPGGVLPRGGARYMGVEQARMFADQQAATAASRNEVFRHIRENPAQFVEGVQAGADADRLVSLAERRGKQAARLQLDADEAVAKLEPLTAALDQAGISSDGLRDVLTGLKERRTRMGHAELRADAAAGAIEEHIARLEAALASEASASTQWAARGPAEGAIFARGQAARDAAGEAARAQGAASEAQAAVQEAQRVRKGEATTRIKPAGLTDDPRLPWAERMKGAMARYQRGEAAAWRELAGDMAEQYRTELEASLRPYIERLRETADDVRGVIKPKGPTKALKRAGAFNPDELTDQAQQALDDLVTLHQSSTYLEGAAASARGAGFDTAGELARAEQAAERLRGRAAASAQAGQAALAEAGALATEGATASRTAERARVAAVGKQGKVGEKAYRQAARTLKESDLEPAAVAAITAEKGNAPGALGELFDQATRKLQRSLEDWQAFSAMPNDWTVVKNLAGKDWAVPTPLAEHVERLGRFEQPGWYGELKSAMGDLRQAMVEKAASSSPALGELADFALPGGAHSLQSWWVRHALLPRLAFHLRNMVGNFWNNALFGVRNPLRYAEGREMLNGSTRMITNARGEVATLGELGQRFMEAGILQGQSYRAGIDTALREVGESTQTVLQRMGWDPITGERAWQRYGRMGRAVLPFVGTSENNLWLMGGSKLGQLIEENARAAHALQRWMEGYDMRGIYESVSAALFDYRRKGAADKAIQSWAPFWMWTKNNLPLALKSIVDNTAQWSVLGHVKRELETGGVDPGNLPAWARDALAIQRGVKDGNLEYYALGGWLPAADAGKVLTPRGALAAGAQLISPPMTALAGALAGTDLQALTRSQPSDLTREGNPDVNFLGGAVSRRARALMSSMPLLADLDRLNPDLGSGPIFGEPMRLKSSGFVAGAPARISLVPGTEPATVRDKQDPADTAERTGGVVFGLRRQEQPLVRNAITLQSLLDRAHAEGSSGEQRAGARGDVAGARRVVRASAAKEIGLGLAARRMGLMQLLEQMKQERDDAQEER